MIKHLLKLELKKSGFRFLDLKTRKIIPLIFSFILGLILIVSLFYSNFLISKTFYKLRIHKTYTTVFLLLLTIILLVSQLTSMVSSFLKEKNKDLYAILPVSREQILTAKNLSISIRQLFFVFGLFILFLVTFLASSNFGWQYYIKLFLLIFLYVLLAFVLSIFLFKPVVWFLKLIKNKNIIKLCLVILITGTLYFLYIRFVQKVIAVSQVEDANFIDKMTLDSIKNSTKYLFFSNFISNIFFEKNFGIFFYKYILVLLPFLAITLIFYLTPMRKIFDIDLKLKKHKKIIKSENKIKRTEEKIKKEKQRKPISALFAKNFLYILRNQTTSFQVIVINVLMPLFIVTISIMVSNLARSELGKASVVPLIMITIFIFILLSSSFQSNVISAEKEAHYISKIIPINYKTNVLVKVSIVYLINVFFLLVSNILLVILKYISPIEFIFILVVSLLFLTSYTLMQVTSDLKNPSYVYGEGDKIHIMFNMNLGLIIGLLQAIIFGIFTHYKTAKPGEFYIPIIVGYFTIIGINLIIFIGFLLKFLWQFKIKKHKVKKEKKV